MCTWIKQSKNKLVIMKFLLLVVNCLCLSTLNFKFLNAGHLKASCVNKRWLQLLHWTIVGISFWTYFGHMRNGKVTDSGSFESMLGQEEDILGKIRHIQKLYNTKNVLKMNLCIFCSETSLKLDWLQLQDWRLQPNSWVYIWNNLWKQN